MSEIEKDNEKQEAEELKIPELIPLLPVRDVVVYPFMIIPLFVGREMSVKAVDSALAGDRMILLATQHDIGDEDPTPDKIYEVGTVAMIMRMLKLPDGQGQDSRPGVGQGAHYRICQRQALLPGPHRAPDRSPACWMSRWRPRR